MPWNAQEAANHKKGLTSKEKRQWAKIANKVYQDTNDEGMAVRMANGVVKKEQKGKDLPRGNK